jgi:hypothetical protein
MRAVFGVLSGFAVASVAAGAVLGPPMAPYEDLPSGMVGVRPGLGTSAASRLILPVFDLSAIIAMAGGK